MKSVLIDLILGTIFVAALASLIWFFNHAFGGTMEYWYAVRCFVIGFLVVRPLWLFANACAGGPPPGSFHPPH